MGTDIITDVLDAVDATLRKPLSATQRAKADAAVREAWAGERPYIGATSEISRRCASQRDAALRAARRRGEHIPYLARAFGLSRQRVYQILRDDADA